MAKSRIPPLQLFQEMAQTLCSGAYVKCCFATVFSIVAITLPAAGDSLPHAEQNSGTKEVALLFDDGPHFHNSPQILNILTDEGIRASFAQIGNNVRAHPELTRAAADAGHQLINHSMTHGHIQQMDDAALREEILAPLEVFAAAIGRSPTLYWPPFGELDPRMFPLIAEGGMRMVPLSERIRFVSTEDWNEETPREAIIQNALAGIDDPSLDVKGERRLILFHEWRDDTVTVLPEIITGLKTQGYRFVIIDELVAEAAQSTSP